MSIITKQAGNKSFVEEVSAIPGGERVKLCIQCGSCTASCPNAKEIGLPSSPDHRYGARWHAG